MNDNPYTVSELTSIIKNRLESDENLIDVWVVGEISNLNYHTSGHIYFSLKDEYALISAAFFKHQNRKLSFILEDGMKVLIRGSINVYEKRGSYQLIVYEVKPEGIGELQKRIEQLKQKFLAEGIFDPKRKRKLPLLPKCLGVVTSPTGAAIRDIIKVARKRYPNLRILISPAQVQGADAAASIARAIELINRPEFGVDVIIAGRGGGSFEDLMPFNEEIVVRAFYNSRVPIVSAVGHQIDHPLCDDAADAFAPTPSAAAEMCIPVKSHLVDEIEYCISRLYSSIISKIRELHTKLEHLTHKRIFLHPQLILQSRAIRLADNEKKLFSAIKHSLSNFKFRLSSLPSLSALVKSLLKDKQYSFYMVLQSLEKLSPLANLRRGYSIVTNENGKIIRSIKDTSIGETVTIEIMDGNLKSTITSLNEVHRAK